MNVVYFHIAAKVHPMEESTGIPINSDWQQELKASIASVDHFHPDWSCHLITDDLFPTALCNIHMIEADPDHMMFERMVHQTKFIAEHFGEPALFIDTDIMVNRPLDDAFQGDVGVTVRRFPKYQAQALMPYNGGVLYSAGTRNALLFWEKMLNHYEQLPDEAKKWWGDQVALLKAVNDGGASIYPVETHNYTPDLEPDGYLEGPYLLHFKGNKKPWMAEYLKIVKDYEFGNHNLRGTTDSGR